MNPSHKQPFAAAARWGWLALAATVQAVAVAA